MQAADNLNGIAIIGMAGRFPDAADLQAFWEMLIAGQEAFQPLSDTTLLAAGVSPELLQHPAYVKAGMVVPEVECFDAAFFGMSPHDAKLTDPQHRLFLECAYQALEQAGYSPATTDVRTGVYAGAGENTYWKHYLQPQMTHLQATVGDYRLHIMNDKDFLATQTAYKLNLNGPALSIQTACSTSLVAVHVACQSLLNFECDLALAGGVSLNLPQGQGYLYQEGMILSPDSHCRAFDANAKGTVASGGVGLVVLKRLEEALQDRDTIYAVIRGSAINNDGADKIGFTAPSVSGQANVIMEAQAIAGVQPQDISYIEAHGTGTPLGDPIEIQALTQAFATEHTGYCALGSVKTNIGHADAAAGITGLIKTALALKHQLLPASLHFTQPNPQIDFANSPFFVNAELQTWKTTDGQPRCAGVSSFGIGGTNAHVIVQEAPAIPVTSVSNAPQLLTLSAKTPQALATASHNLHTHLCQYPEQNLADVAFTLNRCREAFPYRQMLACHDQQDAITQLTNTSSLASHHVTQTPRIALLFPGQGSQYAGMAQELYATNTVFGATVDECADLLQPTLGVDIRAVLFDSTGQYDIHQTAFTQPALFVVEYALAQMWLQKGIQPTALLGHSIGEYVAACLAGVFGLADALALVAMRGQLVQRLPAGEMLAVPLGETAAHAWCSSDISLAVINGVERCVLAGTPAAIERLQIELHEQGIQSTRLHTSHAFHSHLLEPILDTFATRLQQIDLQAPQIPYLSNLTGDWISAAEATDPNYWVKHLRHTVRFADDLNRLFEHDLNVLLEVGPGHTLSTLARQIPTYPTACLTLQSLPNVRATTAITETEHILYMLGQLWLQGAAIAWDQVYAHESHGRVPLPTYPFERQRHWLDLPGQSTPIQPVQHVPKTNDTLPAPNQTPATLTALEQQIAELWQQSLGVSAIKANDDFFVLGGDSLLAVQLLARLQQTFQVTLDSHTLLRASTIYQLAQVIQQRLGTEKTQTESASPALHELLVPIQRGNPALTPLILLYPVGGHVYFYRELARHLNPQLPVYAIRAPGTEGETPLLTTIEAMAATCLQAIRTLQPQGPYQLAGSSFGGTLAYAIAQQLGTEGESTWYLGMIDTPGTGHMPDADKLTSKVEIMRYLLKIGEGIDLATKKLHALLPEEQLSHFLILSGQEDTPLARISLDLTLDLFQTNLQAMFTYQPQAYTGKIHFYLAQERDEFNAQTPAQAWIPLAHGGIEIHTVPGNHITMNTPPHVAHLAKRIQSGLDQASVTSMTFEPVGA